MRFSQRYGHAPIRQALQTDSLDQEVFVGVWNLLDIYIFKDRDYHLAFEYHASEQLFAGRIWWHFLGHPLDSMPQRWGEWKTFVRGQFFKFEWHKLLDFIECAVDNAGSLCSVGALTEALNGFFEEQMVAYRIIDGQVSPIVSEVEVAEIEKAISEADGPIEEHLRTALALLSNRKSPDFRNSVKESISAVESFAQKSTGQPKGTLGQLLKTIDPDSKIHPALKDAFSKLYGYTSDASGIRHALSEESSTGFDEAKFMLVACSAFINFGRGKLAK